MKFLISLVLVISTVGEFKSNINEDTITCRLQDNLEGWNSSGDYQLLNSFISRDTLEYEFDPRYGMYINAIALLKNKGANSASAVEIDTILLYGDPFENIEFQKYFMFQFEDYICSLIDKYPLKRSYPENECSYLIHQRKFRSCG